MQAPALGNVLGKVGGSGARLRGAGVGRVGRVGRMGRAAGPATGAALASRDRRLQWVVGLLVAVAATVPAWLPWLDPRIDLWDVDDGKNHLLRIYHFGWLLERGIWYPRWVPDMFMGFGYPVLNYYAPAFYFLALLLRGLLRLDVWDAFRATGVVAAALGAAGIYAFTVDLWRRPALGVLAALTLLYGPYVFQLNLYKRGDIPEAFGLALLPLLLLALRRLWLATSRGEAAAWFAAAALAGTAEILVHNLTALLAAALAAVWVAYLLVSRPSRVRLLLVLAAGALAAGLTAFFWVPALRETRAVQLEWLGGDGLAYETWMVDPGGETPKHQSPINRQTRTGLIDLHVHYPHQLQAPPKLSLAQVGLGLVTIVSLAAGVVAAGRTSPPDPLSTPVERGNARGRPAVRTPLSDLWRGAGGEVLPLVAPLVPLLVIAGVCWYLTFTASIPVWRRVPGLPLLQFPWRLLGPLGICLAAAGAGALALPLAALERRWERRGQRVGLGLVALVAGAVLFNSLGGREFPFGDDPQRIIDGRAVVADEKRNTFTLGTTSNREFLPREVQIATYTAARPRGRDVFEWMYPEPDWLGGLLHPLDGDVRLLGWRASPLRLSARVANDGAQAGQLGVRQARFPGWRAWLDGNPAPVGAAPYVAEQQAALGFIVVDVPPGEHTIDLAFGPTSPRVVGMAVSLATALAAAGALAWWLASHHGWPRLPLAVGWGLLALGLAYLCWRGLRPASHGFAALPVPAPEPAQGVWRAADLAAPGGRGGGLVVNLAEAVRTGRARVESPTGAALGPDRFVDVRQLTVTDVDRLRGLAGTSRRQWLYVHPPATVSVEVALPAGREVWLQAALALDPAVWEAPVGDGVRFQATVTPLALPGPPRPPGSGGPPGTSGGEAAPEDAPVVVLDRTVNPRARTEQRRWVPVEADLSLWAGRTVRLTLRTLPGDDLAHDWSGWGNPVVVVRESARTRPPATWE